MISTLSGHLGRKIGSVGSPEKNSRFVRSDVAKKWPFWADFHTPSENAHFGGSKGLKLNFKTGKPSSLGFETAFGDFVADNGCG